MSMGDEAGVVSHLTTRQAGRGRQGQTERVSCVSTDVTDMTVCDQDRRLAIAVARLVGGWTVVVLSS
jgi:hypothetical protein